jgi:membrane protein
MATKEDTRARQGHGNGNGVPDKPTNLPKESWTAVLKRTGKQFSDDKLTTWAAALTYYAILSIFPALLVLVSILGLIGPSATQPLIDNLGAIAPGAAKDILEGALTNLQKDQGASGILFVVGLVGALWSASGYIGAFMDASNSVWDVPEGRPIWKKIPLRLGLTALMLVLLAVSAVMVVVSGPIAEQVGNVVGLGSTAVDVWNIAKWPVLVLIVSFMISLLYWIAPNAKQPGFPWVTAGGILAVILWILASAAFAFYVSRFSSYNETYGSLGGVIIFLVWLWISNTVILLGAELNSELERSRQLKAGHPADKEPYLPLKNEPKDKGPDHEKQPAE